MRIVATTICAFALAGCASELPYTIAIGDPSGKKGPDHTKCVLRLDKIVEEVASNYSRSESNNVKSLQVEFEKQLRHGTQTKFGTPPGESHPSVGPPKEGFPALENCKDGEQEHEKATFSFFKKDDYPFIEEIAKKWLTSYALDATDPDQSLDRFREYLRSAQLVQDLAKQPSSAEDTESSFVEKRILSQSQWCGDLTLEA